MAAPINPQLGDVEDYSIHRPVLSVTEVKNHLAWKTEKSPIVLIVSTMWLFGNIRNIKYILSTGQERKETKLRELFYTVYKHLPVTCTFLSEQGHQDYDNGHQNKYDCHSNSTYHTSNHCPTAATSITTSTTNSRCNGSRSISGRFCGGMYNNQSHKILY